jgi:hypothetical protein
MVEARQNLPGTFLDLLDNIAGKCYFPLFLFTFHQYFTVADLTIRFSFLKKSLILQSIQH